MKFARQLKKNQKCYPLNRPGKCLLIQRMKCRLSMSRNQFNFSRQSLTLFLLLSSSTVIQFNYSNCKEDIASQSHTLTLRYCMLMMRGIKNVRSEWMDECFGEKTMMVVWRECKVAAQLLHTISCSLSFTWDKGRTSITWSCPIPVDDSLRLVRITRI